MQCSACGTQIKSEDKFCKSCGAPQEHMKQIPETKEAESKEWYQTGWLWLWFVLFWPVGIYGLVKRAPSEHQKWWWTGLGLLVLFSIVDGDDRTKPTEAEISACKQLIWQHNGYEPSRMKYAGKESGAIIIDYSNPAYGNYWKLRCKNGNPQVWASGVSRWMDI